MGQNEDAVGDDGLVLKVEAALGEHAADVLDGRLRFGVGGRGVGADDVREGPAAVLQGARRQLARVHHRPHHVVDYLPFHHFVPQLLAVRRDVAQCHHRVLVYPDAQSARTLDYAYQHVQRLRFLEGRPVQLKEGDQVGQAPRRLQHYLRAVLSFHQLHYFLDSPLFQESLGYAVVQTDQFAQPHRSPQTNQRIFTTGVVEQVL